MNPILTEIEARVLGSLIEKEIATPEYYPLTLRALTAACNQKSNRDPAMDLPEKDVARGLEGLREKKLAWEVAAFGSRVQKYKHNLPEVLPLTPPQTAVLCELMLRGPQTVGELKTRASRLHPFVDLEQVELALQELMNRPEGAVVVRLPRESGRREPRHAHTLCGEVTVTPAEAVPAPDAAILEVRSENERLARMEQELAALKDEVAFLKQHFEDFRRQLE